MFKRIRRNNFMLDFLKSSFSPIYFISAFIYLEIVFHLVEKMNKISVAFPVLLAIPIGLLFGFIADLFPERIARIVRYSLTAVVILIFGTQRVYSYSFQSYMSWSQSGMAGDVFTNFMTAIVDAILNCLPSIFLFMLPLVALYFLHKHIRPDNCLDKSRSIIQVIAFAVIQLVVVLLLPLSGTGNDTCYELYHDRWMLDNSMRKLGVLTTTRLDIKQFFVTRDDVGVGDDFVPVTPPPEDEDPIVTGSSNPNGSQGGSQGGSQTQPKPQKAENIIEGLDFGKLAAEESNENIKKVYNYLNTLAPTKTNQFTGMFEGYNLIMICAESFSTLAIDPVLTPTLYKLSNEGFVFNNFWTIYNSNTTNGEYSFLTGLMPDLEKPKKDGSFLYTYKEDITMNLTISSYFKGHGITPRGFHNHYGTYYNRQDTHPRLDYSFMGRDEINALGREQLTGWPESDLDMMKATIPEYINDDRFLTYYMSVSGHHNYIFGKNDIADKNKDAVMGAFTDLKSEYQETARAYLATNIELDRALEYLIEELRKAGKLEKTVICLSPDHYPYGITDAEFRAMNGSMKYDGLERWKNTLVIWNSEMDKVEVNKPCCTVDVLPTLLNLFGFEYDSRLYSGNDILSSTYGLAFTTEGCFITNKLVYHARYKTNYKIDKSWSTTSDELSSYISTYSSIVRNRFDIAAYILNYDIYAKLPQDIISAALSS